MSKHNFRQISFFSCLAVIFSLFAGACLNPIDFNEESLPTIKVNVSGAVDVTVKDVAVMWLINRTKTVDVKEFNITRPKLQGETDEQYAYPKVYKDKPTQGTSLASYHSPTENYYTVSVATADTGGQIKAFNFEVQFPRAADYRYYLYWTISGELVLVDETKMSDLPPDPDSNYPDPEPSSLNAQTFVVLNVSPDQNLDEVEFVKETGTYSISGEPRAKDQKMLLLGSGSYATTARYTKNGVPHTTDQKNVVVTKEDGSMAVRTNFAYFYKTKAGDYQISQNWPPIPNDASEDNRPEDALTDGQGILEITNGANPSLPHDIIFRVDIGGTEYPNSTDTHAYMVPGDVNRYILSVGTVHVSFKPMDQPYYGQTIPREIVSKKVTKLTYTNNMGNPDFIPEDGGTGYGAGLVRITNNTTGMVSGITVYNKNNLSQSVSVGYEDFVPPYPIQYGKVGRAPVYGTPEFPLQEGTSQLIQVSLETTEGFEVIQRVAVLRGQIVDIVLSQTDLNPGGNNQQGRYGSKVIVQNQTLTSTNILGMYVYNTANAASSALYYLDISSPPTNSKDLYVLSTIGLPIVQDQDYAAKLSVYGNGKIALIDKNFNEGSDLYSANPDSHVRTITLNQSDLPPELIENFVEVTGISTTPSPYVVTSYTESDLDGSNPSIINNGNGTFNFNNIVTVSPSNATTKYPIEWSLVPGGGSQYVSLAGNVFTVTGIAPVGSRTVTVKAVIRNAAGTATVKTDFEDTVTIELAYHTQIRTQKVTGFSLAPVNVLQGTAFDLRSLVTLSPSGANIDGVPITANNLSWGITDTSNTGSSISGHTLTAGTSGTVTITATMGGAYTSTGSPISQSVNITITSSAPSFTAVTSISLNIPSPQVDFFTREVSGSKSVYATGSLYLSPSYVGVFPPSASVQSPIEWSIVSNPSNAVTINNSTSLLQVNTSLSGNQIPANGSQVQVRATIPNSGAGGSNMSSSPVTITLVERRSVPVPQRGINLSVLPTSILIGESINLNTLVNLLPSGAMYDNVLLTSADLEWSISGSAGTLSNGVLTGTALGTVTVRAVLPANKNLGQEVSAETTVTVTSPPPVYPATVTLRFFNVDEGDTYKDTVTQIALVQENRSLDASAKRYGHTGIRWVTGKGGSTDKNNFTYLSNFTNYYLKAKYPSASYDILTVNLGPSKTYDKYVDITVKWPANGSSGYDIFFVEKDSRVRGYTSPWMWNPTGDKTINLNFIFHLDMKYVYDNYLLPMEGKLQRPKESGYREVIPIYYSTHRNVGAIMRGQGVNKVPQAMYGTITKGD